VRDVLGRQVAAVDVDGEERVGRGEGERRVQRERAFERLAHAVELGVAREGGTARDRLAQALGLRDLDHRGEHGAVVLLRCARVDAQDACLGCGREGWREERDQQAQKAANEMRMHGA
jgi:hypothetical protein